MKKDDCIFCKLANGDIPTNWIYEDDDFKVILDAGPATKGHALVLPKNHFDNLMELDADALAKALPVAQLVAKRMLSVLGCAGINMVQNNGEAAGQTVNHFHIHLIPRYANEDETVCAWTPHEFAADEMTKICETLRF